MSMSIEPESSGERLSPEALFCRDISDGNIIEMLDRVRKKSRTTELRSFLGQYFYTISTNNDEGLPVQQYAQAYFDGVAFAEDYERRIFTTPKSREEITYTITDMIVQSRIDRSLHGSAPFDPVREGAKALMASAEAALNRHPDLLMAMQYASSSIADGPAVERMLRGFGMIVDAIDRYKRELELQEGRNVVASEEMAERVSVSEQEIDELIDKLLSRGKE